MISVIDRLEQVDGSSEELILSKMQVYEMMNDKKSVYTTLKTLSEKHPNNLNYKVMLGNWLMQNEKQKEAYKIFTAALKEEPGKHVMCRLLIRLSQGHERGFTRQYSLEQILTSPKTESQSKASMMQQVIRDNEENGGDSTKVISLFKKVMKANPGMVQSLN